MPWYHLSTTQLQAITRLQVPQNDAGEEEVPRFCVAPTVWQALLAVGGFGADYFIHVVDVVNPIPSPFAKDAAVTGEYVITQGILDAAGGSIPARCVGRVCCDGERWNLLHVLRQAGQLPADPAEELETVWRIEGDRWRCRLTMP